MTGVDRLNEFLRHAAANDLPLDELLLLKAKAFEACAADARAWGDTPHAEALEVAAAHAREAISCS